MKNIDKKTIYSLIIIVVIIVLAIVLVKYYKKPAEQKPIPNDTVTNIETDVSYVDYGVNSINTYTDNGFKSLDADIEKL